MSQKEILQKQLEKSEQEEALEEERRIIEEQEALENKRKNIKNVVSNDAEVPIPEYREPEYNEKDILYNLIQCSRKIKDLEDQIKTRPLSNELSRVDLINLAEDLQLKVCDFIDILVNKFRYKKEDAISIIRKSQDIKTYYGYKVLLEK
jgi:hypothetical protein